MTDWSAFIGIVGVLLVLLLALARASAPLLGESTLSEASEMSTESVDDGVSTETDPKSEWVDTKTEPAVDGELAEFETEPDTETAVRSNPKLAEGQPELSTAGLLANVVFSQGLFGTLLVVMAWYTEIPAWAFGLAVDHLTVGTVGTGVGVGVVLYGLNEATAAIARWQGLSTPTGLREALAPETAAGWVVLLVVVLPIIAGFEELLFRGALIGVIHAGFGVPLWPLAVGSSAAFALGHNAQGRLGIVVTGLLGVGLAAAFIWTGSLLVVVVAHYVVNALEFVIHERLELA